jgi:NAD(P)-dependent dehydrogenase (short-subunit alcohol dehydrogenase family)
MDLLTVVITGANRGIGLELTKIFLQAGQWKIIACCRNPDVAGDLQNLAQNADSKIDICSLDVTEDASVEEFANYLSGQKVDVLLNNAGVMGGDRQSAFDMDYDAWLDTFKVNTMAPLRMVQNLMRNLKLSDQPKIVTISSQMGSLNRKSKGSYAYRSSKAAVNKVMQVLSLDLEEEDIIVSMIHPGWVQTNMGGKEADISPQESAAGLFKVITSLQKSDSGRFLQYTGEEHPW